MSARGQRGFALLVVLWAVGFLALIGTQIGATGRIEARLAANLRAAAVAEAAADGAVHMALMRLADGPEPSWAPEAAPRRITLGEASVELRMADLGGRIDPNAVSEPLLLALFQRAGLDGGQAAELVEAFTAWRRRPPPNQRISPEMARYEALGLAWGPAHGPFRDVAELALLRGMTPDLFARIAPLFALHLAGAPLPELADPLVAGALEDAMAAGGDEFRSGLMAPLPVVEILARAETPLGGRFTRRAVARMRPPTDTPPWPRAWEILAWDEGR